MATEGALTLITKIENLTNGLNLTMVVLHLQEQPTSLESNCTGVHGHQAHSHILDVITILSVIMTILRVNSNMYLRYGKTILCCRIDFCIL